MEIFSVIIASVVIIVLLGIGIGLVAVFGYISLLFLYIPLVVSIPYIAGAFIDSTLGWLLFFVGLSILLIGFSYHKFSRSQIKNWDK